MAANDARVSDLNRDETEQRHPFAEALEVSRPRVVETAEELDALPVDSVVIDFAGTPRTKRHGDSHMPAGWTHAGRDPISSALLADGRPMAVLYEPREG